MRITSALPIIILVALSACSAKDDFLNEKSNANLATLSSLDDVELLLHNEQVFNLRAIPTLGGASTDDYYSTTDQWENASSMDQNTYVWAKSIYPSGANSYDWSIPYSQVYYANNALEAVGKIGGGSERSNILKGMALFFRSAAFFNLLQIFTSPYDSSSSSQQLGIPLRLNTDINVTLKRQSEKDCYDRVIGDLKAAVELLPSTSRYNTQPNKNAANALLARIYLSIGDYNNAFIYSDRCLNFSKALTDYNSIKKNIILISPSTPYPLVEVIYNATFLPGFFTGFNTRADTTLYNSYEQNDLRKTVFFSTYFGYPTFDGSYEFKNYGVFGGLANDEIYLIRAECYARMGKNDLATADLNGLLINRFKTGTYVNRNFNSSEEALVEILKERRKELCFRGLRWQDLRRLNKEGKYSMELTRVISGTVYKLPPNDPRYALPIPDNEITLSGIEQNAR